jgi:hypothetical protein
MENSGVVKVGILVGDLDEHVSEDGTHVPDLPQEPALVIVDRKDAVEESRGDVLKCPWHLEGNALGEAEIRLEIAESATVIEYKLRLTSGFAVHPLVTKVKRSRVRIANHTRTMYFKLRTPRRKVLPFREERSGLPDLHLKLVLQRWESPL